MAAFVSGEVADYQMSALLMAAFLRGLDDAETVALTEAMLHSGDVLDSAERQGSQGRQALDGRRGRQDQHLPGAARRRVRRAGAHDLRVAGSATPGGTLDKLEAIPGYSVDIDAKRFERIVRRSARA